MFETHESAKLEVPTGMAAPGEYVWGFAYSRLFMHWFHVVAKSQFEDDEIEELRNLYLTQIDDLITLAESDEWEIREVSLVSPGHMNNSGHWQMDLLEEILIGRESTIDHEQYGYVFVLDNGQRYLHSFNKIEDELIEMKTLYRTKKANY